MLWTAAMWLLLSMACRYSLSCTYVETVECMSSAGCV